MSEAARPSGFQDKPKWLPIVIIPSVILIVSLWYLMPSPAEFPMDDTYIHFVYAENLAEYGKLFFNSPDEIGIGATSLSWVALLAGGLKLGIPVHLGAKLLGMLSLSLVGVGLYLLLSKIVDRNLSLFGALLISLSGNYVWFALSGMETILFLALGVLIVLLYQEKRWILLGLSFGFIVLTRPEGVLLPGAILLVEIWRTRRIPREVVVSLVLGALISAPWYGYLFWRTGLFLPTSAVGKKLSFDLATDLILGRNPALGTLANIPGIVYVGSWLSYVILFVLGGMAGPPPHLPLGRLVGAPDYSVSFWAILGQLVIVLPLLILVSKRIASRSRLQGWVQAQTHRPLVAFLVWVIIHNIGYMLFIPVPGTAGRYAALNLIVLWGGLAHGLGLAVTRNRFWTLQAGSLIFLAAFNTVYWNSVYDANLEHMVAVRIEAAHYVRDELPPENLCAAFDIGAVRYHSQRSILDLGGLIDPEAGQRLLESAYDNYLVHKGATCLVLPGRTGTDREGWFDFAKSMGFTESALFQINQVAIFEIDRDRWLVGYLPTNNYQASVTIYGLQDKQSID